MLAGVQLFSLRKYLKDEAGYERVFSRVHEMGAEVVQLSGGKPVPAEFIRGLTEKYSLPVCVTHDNFDRLQNDLAGLVKEHRTYGCDALGIGIGQAQLLVHGQPILQTDDAKHGAGEQMAGDDVASQPSRQWMRCAATSVEHGIEVVLRALIILVPPLAERRHIVRGNGAYRAIGVLAQVTEPHVGVFGHALYLQAEYLEVFQHPWNAVGHHAQVFRAYQHACGLHQSRQLAHGLPIPELVVAAIEIVIVKAVEGLFVAVVQALVDEIVLRGDARMEKVGVFPVAQEEHVTDKGIEPVTQP